MTKQIDQLLNTWAESERSGNADALGAVLTDDFVGVGPVGFVLGKDAWLGRLRQGVRYDELDLDEVSSRQHGDAAIVVAHQHAVGTYPGGSTFPDLRVSFTVVSEDGGELRIAGMHYSFIGMPNP